MKVWIRYLITSGVGAVIAFSVAAIMGIFSAEGATDIVKILSDAFAISGVLLVGSGLLVYASNGGIFNMLAYGALSFLNAFRRNVSDRKYKSYYDYTEAKKEKKVKFAHLMWAGLLYLALSLVFLILYYKL